MSVTLKSKKIIAIFLFLAVLIIFQYFIIILIKYCKYFIIITHLIKLQNIFLSNCIIMLINKLFDEKKKIIIILLLSIFLFY